MDPCQPYCEAADLQKLAVMSTDKERFYFCRRCRRSWKVTSESGQTEEPTVEDLGRLIRRQGRTKAGADGH